MSAIKYEQERMANGEPVRFDPHGHYRFPFRGPMPSAIPWAEADKEIIETVDFKNGVFYTGDEQQNKEYTQIQDRIANKWYSLCYIERWRDPGDIHFHVYMEWVEGYTVARRKH